MIVERYLRRWVGAGLIDADLEARILAWERSRARPYGLWALAALGAVAIVLGVLAVVGANWEDIPAALKLAVCLALHVALGGFVWYCALRDWPWRRELSSLLLFGLVLAGIALIGQVYHLQSAAWRALVLWLGLTTPFLFLATRSIFVGLAWAAAALTAWFSAFEPMADGIRWLLGGDGTRRWYDTWALWCLMLLLPMHLLIIAGALRRTGKDTARQGETLVATGLLGTFSVVSAVVAFDFVGRESFPVLRLAALAALGTGLAALAAALTSPPGRNWREPALLAGAFLLWLIGIVMLRTDSIYSRPLELALRAAAFVTFWSALAWLFAREERRVLFGLCVTVVALRLLVIYFEAIGGLGATGLGLIGGGVLLIGLAAAGWMLVRKVTPQHGRPAGAVP